MSLFALKKIIYQSILLTSCVLLLISCTSGVKKAPDDTGAIVSTQTPDDESPDSLIAQGKKQEAAMLYLKQAGKVEQSLRPSMLLIAAQLLIEIDSIKAASDILIKIQNEELTESQTTHLSYLTLLITLKERQADKSLQILNALKTKDYSEFVSEAELLNLSIQAHELRGDNDKAMISRIHLLPYLTEEQEIIDNQINIVRVLVAMEIDSLNKMSESSTDETVKSWVDLALLIKKSKNPFRLANMLSSWKSLHPQHPLRDQVIAALAPKPDLEPPKLDNIALLLPLSGSLSKAGSAVRDGFLTGYYNAEISTTRPTIRIYDTADGTNLIEIYQKAVNEGADVIVGPLRKDSANQIALHGQHEVPVLVLNQIDDSEFYHRNFYQFSLSPESEAKQIAQRAWKDGHNHAAVIFPDNKWGMRLASAFTTEWEELGGIVATQASYDSKKNDFSKPIKSLLSIDESEQRKRDLSKLLKTRLRFEPRRRQDIDMIFMAALPRQARLIPPQLRFYHAEKLPVYTTSHSFAGRFNRKNDRDLNGVVIADMPWTLNKSHMETAKLQIYRTWPNRSKQFNRLYALGTDAYNVLYYLNWLRGNPHAHIQGATGELFMNERNQVMRILSWAKFRKGLPRLIASSSVNAQKK